MFCVQGWKTFFEEPIMLIAFVLLGRNLELRAKLKATSDLTGLLSIIPSKARLLLNNDANDSDSTVEVPCSSLSIGDQIVILPGVCKIIKLFIFSLFLTRITSILFSLIFQIIILLFL